MSHSLSRVLTGLGVALVLAAPASAQVTPATGPLGPQSYTPYPSPVLSPYLNLLRPGNLAFNYFNYVRPQIDYTKSFQELQKKVFTEPKQTAKTPSVREKEKEELPVTGSRMPGYFTHHKYFMTQPTVTPSRAGVPTSPYPAAKTTPGVKTPTSGR